MTENYFTTNRITTIEAKRNLKGCASLQLSMMARGGPGCDAPRQIPTQPNHTKRHPRYLGWRFCLFFPHISPQENFRFTPSLLLGPI